MGEAQLLLITQRTRKGFSSPRSVGVGVKIGKAQLGMGCQEKKNCRKLSDVLVVFPLVLRSHNPV